MDNYKEAEIFDPVDLSLFICRLTGEEVIRSTMLDTIDLKFEKGERIIGVHGEAGMGKTVLLSQFVARHKKSCAAIFIDVVNKQSYAEDSIIIDLYRQVYFYVNDCEPDIGEVDVKRLSVLFYRLENMLSRSKERFYIVIDGLSDIPKADEYALKSIVDILPLSHSNICFLISDGSGVLENYISRKSYSLVEMMVFSRSETAQLLSGLSEEDVDAAHRIFKGVPEVIETFKRLIEDGATPEEIFNGHNLEVDASGLYDAEWERNKEKIEGAEYYLGVVCHSVRSIDLESVAEMLGVSVDDARENLRCISFLDVKNGEVTFASNGVKRYCQDKLRSIEKGCVAKIVASYKSSEASAESLTELSEYYQRLGDAHAIVSQLSNPNIGLIYKNGKSVNQALRQIKIGRNAAKSSESEIDLFRMAQVESMLIGLKTPPHLRNQLDSYLEEGDYESALGLIASTPIEEEQLQLLALIAAYQKKNEAKVDESIKSRVVAAFDGLNAEHLGIDRAVELAKALFPAFPDLSMKIIKSVDGMEGGGGNKSDYAFYQLSMEAVKKDGGNVDLLLDNAIGLEEKKRNALSILEIFRPGTPASTIASKVDGLEDPSDAIYILRAWIAAYPDAQGAHLLCEKILNLVVSTSDFHANASLYADVAAALANFDRSEGEPVREKIVSQLGTLDKTGPSIDYARLLANLIVYERSNQVESNTLDLLRNHVNELSDSATKLSVLTLLGADEAYKSITIDLFGSQELKEAAFDKIVDETADQFDIIKDALLRESTVSLSNGLAWAKRLNTRPRRDLATSVALKQAFESEQKISISKAYREIINIKEKNFQSRVALSLFELAAKRDSLTEDDVQKLIKLRNKIKNNFVLCKMNCHLIEVLINLFGRESEKVKHAEAALERAWREIDGDWIKIDIAYNIHRRLYHVNNELAKKYREFAVEISRNKAGESEDVVESQVLASDIAIRSFYFLCEKDILKDGDFDAVLSSVNALPARIPKIKQLSRLASALYITGNKKLFDRLVEISLIPLLDSMGDEYSKELTVALYWSAPVLFCYSRGLFLDKLEVVREDETFCDELIGFVQRFIFNKCLLGDPFDPVKNYRYKVSAKDLEDHIFLLKHLREDGRCYFGCAKLVEAVVRNGRNNYYTRPQLNLLQSFILAAIKDGFDSDNYISHDGYRICFKALHMKLENIKSGSEWDGLKEEVYTIPVKSDQVFTLGQIIELMPSSLRDKKKVWLREAVELTDQLSSGLDKIARYEYLIDIGMDVDRPYVKSFVRRAVLLSTAENSEEYEQRRKSLIDSVFSMDKDFAAGLSAMSDLDPARKAIINKSIERKREERKVREEFDVGSEDIKNKSLSRKYPDLTWSLLGKLNADNHNPTRNARHIDYLSSVSRYSMIDAYPMFSYYVHSLGRGCLTKEVAYKKLPPLFNAAIQCSELFISLFSNGGQISDSPTTGGQIVFGEQEKDRAEEFMLAWVRELSEPTITVVDPYFGISDLELVGRLIDKDPNFDVKVLTSYATREKICSHYGLSIEETVRKYWEENVCSDAMPFMSLVFCGLESLNNQMPIHDRWIIGKDSALRLGGSLNGVGGKRISSISKMNKEEVLALGARIGGYIDCTIKQHKQERVRYQTVTF